MMRLLLLLTFGFLVGCGGRTVEVVRVDAGPETVPADDGFRVTTGDLDRAYEEIAILRVGGRSGRSAAEQLTHDLRDAARRVEADAVVRVDFEPYGNGESGSLEWYATGTAVRFR